MQVSFHTRDGAFEYQEVTNVHTILHRGDNINLYYNDNAEHRFYKHGKLALVERLKLAFVIQLDSTVTHFVVTK